MQATTQTRDSRRRKRRTPRQPAARKILIAGAEGEAAQRLAEAVTGLGYEAVFARTFEETLSRLQQEPYALWVLDADALRLSEAMVWASLRFAAEDIGRRPLEAPAPAASPRTPAIVLVRAGQPDAMRALNAAACAPTITGWNREGWILGVQETPFEPEELAALARELFAETCADAAD
ncbi:MAG: hypothetical protein KIS92_07775 [Planctomycetota bacterium]|nr:hypothetical protein [Planctomycetota bacterium]